MSDKKARHHAIKTILSAHRVPSQDLLSKKLKEAGFTVTQATLSRDLKQLEVAKISDGNGFRYSLSGTADAAPSKSSFLKDLKRDVVSVQCSGHTVVVKTRIGHADSVAFAFDNLKIPSILGTIGGDDTVFMILSEATDPTAFLESIKAFLPVLNESESQRSSL